MKSNNDTTGTTGAKNHPFRKQVSDLDIELDTDTDDGQYLQILAQTLPRLIADFIPDMIFYQSAVDVLATDKLGKFGLTIEGCKARDEYVLLSLLLSHKRHNSLPAHTYTKYRENH